MPDDRFHPLVRRWFSTQLGPPTAAQNEGWGHIAAGRDTLIAAPTGSGKTLAAFLWALNRLIERGTDGTLPDKTAVVYVSPLKALGNDIQKNLRRPLDEINALAVATGDSTPPIRVAVRSGDTPAAERRAMLRRPPHILITTPESLYILLTAESSRRMLSEAETIIVDEIHAIAGDKRAAHLALSLERLDALAGRRLQRIGLSATQRPIESVARLLIGNRQSLADGRPDCAIVDVGHKRQIELSIEVMDYELGPIASHELYGDVYERIVALAATHRTTIVFVNTRRLVERVAHQLGQRLGSDKVAAHHGSLSREIRLRAEDGLKDGSIPVVVATASLELGIDVGHVDLVCHIGAPRSIATLLQRVGRSGHWLGAIPKGILFPVTRDDLVQCAAVVRAVQAGELDCVVMGAKPLDILAQQIVAGVAGMEMGEEELWQLIARAYPYRDLERREFEAVVTMVSEGIAARRGRRSAHIHRDQIHGRLRARRGARLAAITSGGAIPDTADFDVVEEPGDIFVGKVNEDFAIESVAGDVFLLGNRSWRIRRVENGKVRVVDAEGAAPTIPFWLGEAPARTMELSAAVADLREAIADRLADRAEAAAWLCRECALDESAAQQLIAYIADSLALLGALPSQRTVVAERFFDESGGMQLVIHSPFGGRINRAWGLALRKRFCRTFDFELQAAATDDGLILSLSEQHSFPLADIFALLRSDAIEEILVQAALQSPLFTNRWRWNATRALALLRFSGGKKVPLQIQRMRAEDLLAAVFPAQVACQDNHGGGPIEPPDHPLVQETLANCLHEAMDLDGLRHVLMGIESGAIRTHSVDTPAPSPLSHEILNANPYAFLDDAPLEERRARAVSLRRVDPELAGGMGALDPAAIDEVRRQAWPDVRDADELHDLLLSVFVLPVSVLDKLSTTHGGASTPLADSLLQSGRATWAHWQDQRALVASERTDHLRVALTDVEFAPPPAGYRTTADGADVEPEAVDTAVCRGWLECLGPIRAADLATILGFPSERVAAALFRLESDGAVLQGRFTPASAGSADNTVEWCERRLLARIHRLTVTRLRKEIEAVSPADLMRFLLRWQHVEGAHRLAGKAGLLRVIEQLEGLELPAPAWEGHVLPARMRHYDPADLEHLCLSGEVAWARLGRRASELDDGHPPRATQPQRTAPLAFVRRCDLPLLIEPLPDVAAARSQLTPAAAQVYDLLHRDGASFLADIARSTGRLPSQTEDALWELVACGMVTGDGVGGLRALVQSAAQKRKARSRLRAIAGGRLRPLATPAATGRWALLNPSERPHDRIEWFAQLWLQRYGVVLRELLARESRMPRWRELLPVLRRMEARGEIRGGRFVSGFVGEQFALPEAVDALRAVRRQPADRSVVVVAAADPLNLVGILTPGQRISPLSNQYIAYQDGIPTAVGNMGEVTSRIANARAGNPTP